MASITEKRLVKFLTKELKNTDNWVYENHIIRYSLFNFKHKLTVSKLPYNGISVSVINPHKTDINFTTHISEVFNYIRLGTAMSFIQWKLKRQLKKEKISKENEKQRLIDEKINKFLDEVENGL